MEIAKGKTKIIRKGSEENTVIMETLDVLTGGDAAKKEHIQGIGTLKTTQAVNVFSLLNKKGLPTAFIKKQSSTELLCYQCEMLPLEFVIRRYAYGSYLQRHPEFNSTGAPHRFGRLVTEIFHKWAVITVPITNTAYQLDENKARDLFLHKGVWQEGVYTDPYIQVAEKEWVLYPAKKQLTTAKPLMTIKPLLNTKEYKELIQKIMIPTFEVLEEAWQKIVTISGPVQMVDLKIEAGRRLTDGKIVIADVVDNDSWRIWPGGDCSKQLDKQCFRDEYPLAQVAEKYMFVTQLTEKFV